MDPLKQIITDSQTEGSEFSVSEDRAFILMEGYVSGEWKLQIRTPNGNWMDIADSSGGISFNSDGLQFFYAQPWLNYRIAGGDAGAEAWLLAPGPNPGLK